MCGIVGFTGKPDIRLLKRMLKQIRHRGPDDQGDYFDDQISLGMTRLAINDLRSGLYPLFSEDKKVVLIFNGEIYNYQELKNQLSKKRVKLRTKCDAEVILSLYQKHGRELVKYIEGMYAFALYDKNNKTLFLVRDRFGEKPLYYYCCERKLIFASEVAALLTHPAVSKKIDLQALYYFLRFGFFPTDYSIFNGIQKLPPASWLEYNLRTHKIKSRRYWDLDFDLPDCRRNEREWVGGVEKRLTFSIKQRLRAEMPVGLFLSGGVDSGLIAAISKEVGVNLPVYSIVVSGLGYDEGEKSEKLARFLNLRHHKIPFSSQDLLASLKGATKFLDEPLSDPAALPTFLLSKEAKRKVKIVLTGDGADELFGGYDRYLNHLRQQKWLAWTPKVLDWGQLFEKIRIPYNFLTWFSHLGTHYFPQQVFTQRKAFILLNKNAQSKVLSTDPFIDLKKDQDQPLDMMLYTDIKSLLPNQYLTKIDKMTMAWGLEARAPFLDKVLAEYVATMPTMLKINSIGQEKYILHRLAERYLPRESAWQKKQGFYLPLDKWLRGPLTFLLDELVDWVEKDSLPLNKQMVKILVKGHRRGENLGNQLWALLSLKFWQENLK